MRKLFLILLMVCVAQSAFALTVPPWWMINQSATDNTVASFGVPIVTPSLTQTTNGMLPASFAMAYGASWTNALVDTTPWSTYT